MKLRGSDVTRFRYRSSAIGGGGLALTRVTAERWHMINITSWLRHSRMDNTIHRGTCNILPRT